MNLTQKWLARVRPHHNPAENALIANMRADPNIPWLNSLAAMHRYARQRWPHDPAAASVIKGVWSGINAGRHDIVPRDSATCKGFVRGGLAPKSRPGLGAESDKKRWGCSVLGAELWGGMS
jgi:hypothetical protein